MATGKGRQDSSPGEGCDAKIGEAEEDSLLLTQITQFLLSLISLAIQEVPSLRGVYKLSISALSSKRLGLTA